MVFGKSIEKAKWDDVGLGGSNSLLRPCSILGKGDVPGSRDLCPQQIWRQMVPSSTIN